MTRPPRGPNRPTESPTQAWEREQDLVSSAGDGRGTIPPTERTAGSITLSGQRLAEALAREVIGRAFAQAGLRMTNDVQFRTGNTLLTLDGFDPIAKVGFQYVSHGDADVVTDFDAAAEMALRELDEGGKIRLFIVHDGDVRDVDELIAMTRAFIDGLDITHPGG